MTYAAILEAYGYERFAADARDRGASSFILVDLPVEEQPELRRIQLVEKECLCADFSLCPFVFPAPVFGVCTSCENIQ